MRKLVALGRLVLAASALATLTVASTSPPQTHGLACTPEWLPAVGELGTFGKIRALTMFDDGSGGGPALYAAGDFLSAGDAPASRIAKWDGRSWSPLGEGIQGPVAALAVYNDGTGPALYAGGSFVIAGLINASHLAKWNGTSWSPVGGGTNGPVRALKMVFDLSTPSLQSLLVGGSFTSAGGVAANRIAKWNGSAWSTFGGGVGSASLHAVNAIEVEFFTATDMILYVGGRFDTAGGGVVVKNVARFQGSTWSAMGTGASGMDEVHALLRHNDGATGYRLFAAGDWMSTSNPLNGVARWEGGAWSAVGGGVAGCITSAHSMATFDDELGGGPALYVGGTFTTAGGAPANRIVQYRGGTWMPVGTGVGSGCAEGVYAMTKTTLFGSDPTPRLFFGGSFNDADGRAAGNVAQWSGGVLDTERGSPNAAVNAFAAQAASGGNSPRLYMGGDFTRIAGNAVNRITKLEDGIWSRLGSGVNGAVHALQLQESSGGTPPSLYAAGSFTQAGGVACNNVARWDGSAWHSLGAGLSGAVYTLALFDDGSGEALYAGGSFFFSGALLVNSIAKWDGITWTALGTGMDSSVETLVVHDDGSGPALFAGGWFSQAGGSTAFHIAKWSGSTWSSLGSGSNYWGKGANYVVEKLITYDDGTGLALYAGGYFTAIGDSSAQYLAKWDGSAWSALGAGVGVNDNVTNLVLFDDGTGGGPALIAAGWFTTAGGSPASRIAKWDGASWSALGTGLSPFVRALTSYDDGSGIGALLYAGGTFDVGPADEGRYLARWGGCGVPPTTCTGAVVGYPYLDLVNCGTVELPYAIDSDWPPGPGTWSIDYGVGFPASWDITLTPVTEHSVTLAFTASDSPTTGSWPITLEWTGLCNGTPYTWSLSVTCRLIVACPSVTLYCYGDGSGTPCPCGNTGGIGEGCANSTGEGATLTPFGSPSISGGGFALTTHQASPGQPGLYFQGLNATNGGSGAAFGDGLRCAGGGVVRLQVRVADNTGYSFTNIDLAVAGGAQAGDTRYFQVWYRDPSGVPCGSGLNWTNGLGVTWLP